MGTEEKALKILLSDELKPTPGRIAKLAELLDGLTSYHQRNVRLELVHHGGNAHRLTGDDRAVCIGNVRVGGGRIDGKSMDIWAVW